MFCIEQLMKGVNWSVCRGRAVESLFRGNYEAAAGCLDIY